MDPVLDGVLSRARAERPELAVPEEVLTSWLAARCQTPEAARELCAGDVLLACACAEGVTPAIDLLEQMISTGLRRWVARAGSDPPFLDEVGQLLLERLLVPQAGSSARIAAYMGRGPLEKWLHVAALRIALNLRRGDRRYVALEEAQRQWASADPELQLIEARHRHHFREAFQAAFQTLAAREREIIRLVFVDGQSLEEVGRKFAVNRSTVCRWVAAARKQMLDGVRLVLRERLALDTAELDSVIGRVPSTFDVSLPGLLRSGGS